MDVLRMCLAEILLDFIVFICPNNEEGDRLVKYIHTYCEEVVYAHKM